MTEVGTVTIGGRTVTNLRFADDIVGLAGDEQELVNLVSRLDKTSASHGMEISAEKTKLLTDNTNGINKKINVRGQRLETVSKFKYLGSVITDEGSKPEIVSNNSNASIFLYACETWTLTAKLQRSV